MTNNSPLKPIQRLGLAPSLAIFGTAALALILGTHFLIPFLQRITGWETVILWFLVAGLGIFLPMLIASCIMIKKEGQRFDRKLWTDRLRFRAMTRIDWLWGIGGIGAIALCSVIIMKLLELIVGSIDSQPPFMSFEPLSAGRYWILLIWFPYWLLNIFGEEIFWRGVLLPRQEVVFGGQTWLIHGFCWGVFHIAFGWQLLLTLLPILFIQSYVVYKRQNTWLGVFIHALINGPSFLAISFGWI